jgi:hypothetical protein
MLRRLLVTVVGSAGLLTPLSFVPAAQADYHRVEVFYPAPTVVYVHRHAVYYRPTRFVPWAYYGTYRHHRDAERAARYLLASGYQVAIR